MPIEPATLQASHDAEHAVLQQTPSTQLPLRHSLDNVQAAPLANEATHAPPLQWCAAAHPASFAQLDGQEALDPLHTKGEHDGLPDVPAALLLQMPTEPATLQASHAPEQALLQQTPSTQLPLEHWLFPVHVAALASFATQLVPLQ